MFTMSITSFIRYGGGGGGGYSSGGGGGYSSGGGSRYGGGGGGGGGKFDNPGQKLKSVDWNRYTLSTLKKNFYTPSSDVANR